MAQAQFQVAMPEPFDFHQVAHWPKWMDGNTSLRVEGVACMPMEFKNKQIVEEVYILDKKNVPLLSRRAMIAMDLVKLNIDVVSNDLIQNFPEVFVSLGTIAGDPYKIRLKGGCHPYALATPRGISAPLWDKVKFELDQWTAQAQLLYGRKLRSTLPSITNFRNVGKRELQDFKNKDSNIKERNKRNFDFRHRPRNLPLLRKVIKFESLI